MSKLRIVSHVVPFLLMIALAPPLANAQASMSGHSNSGSFSRPGSASNAVAAQVQSEVSKLGALVEQMANLQQQLAELLADKPKPPKGNSPSAKNAYEKSLADWRKKVRAKQAALSKLQKQIEKQAMKIEKLERGLTSAQARDRNDARKARAAAKKATSRSKSTQRRATLAVR